MNLIQFKTKNDKTCVGIVQNEKIIVLKNFTSAYELFWQCINTNKLCSEYIAGSLCKKEVAYKQVIEEKRILAPLFHRDPYHTWITGTGLTHFGSAFSRNQMHRKDMEENDQENDSIKMFKMGVREGRPTNGRTGVQPEWFYKGNGLILINPGDNIKSPKFGLDLGEEPELVGIYIIDCKGNPRRIGFALGNEFSDHKMEKINYLYLAHSKLRVCSYGPELNLDINPDNIRGKSSIIRNKKTIWSKEFATGETHMSHTIANLEYHHFKYEMFRQPGDVHIHFFGTSVMSFTDHVQTMEGDQFEVKADEFGAPLINTWVN
jgi:hypothetical protein